MGQCFERRCDSAKFALVLVATAGVAAASGCGGIAAVAVAIEASRLWNGIRATRHEVRSQPPAAAGRQRRNGRRFGADLRPGGGAAPPAPPPSVRPMTNGRA